MPGGEVLKVYFDYKSPYAFLAFEPALALPQRFAVSLRWMPFQLRIKGKGERSVQSEWKVRYSYLDARRFANRRGGIVIRGPRKVYDSTPALVGAHFALDRGSFVPYSRAVFARFFERALEIDDPDAIAGVFDELDASGDAYRAFLAGEGAGRFDAAIAEAQRDQVFGVPILVFRGEPFWGQDRIPLLEERLRESGLALPATGAG